MYVEQDIMVEAICMLGENYEALLEAYAGKPKQLLKCEEYLSHIVDELNAEYDSVNNTIGGIATSKKVTKDYEWNKKLETELANFFKVGKVNIYWSSGAGPNAFTINHLSVFIFNNRHKYLAGNASDLTIDICIYEECVTIAGLNAAELMAVILHEVGHNFYFCPITMGFEIFAFIVTLPVGLIKRFIEKLKLKGKFIIEDLIKKYLPAIYNLLQLYNNYTYQFNHLFLPLELINIVSSAICKLALSSPVDAVLSITGYGNETAADSMCAKYGYGPEQASALAKFDNPKNAWTTKIEKNDKIGITSVMHDFSCLMIEIVSLMMLDPHPNSNQRAANMLKKLKRDLATGDYPDGMKKDLENEIKRMEDIFAICSKNASPSNIQIRQGWFDIINGITGNNSDLRQIFAFYYEPLGY